MLTNGITERILNILEALDNRLDAIDKENKHQHTLTSECIAKIKDELPNPHPSPLPCAHCGDNDVTHEYIERQLTCYSTYKCMKCGIRTGLHSSKQLAIEAWNKRVKLTSEQLYGLARHAYNRGE